MIRFIVTIVAGFVLFSCGGAESYKTPLVMATGIQQGDCVEVGTAAIPAEEISVRVRDKTVVVSHSNILLSKGSILGIEDRDGAQSWKSDDTLFYLDGGTDFISLHEGADLVGGEVACLYSLTVTIQNISGGEYTFYLYDYRGRLIPEAQKDLEVQ